VALAPLSDDLRGVELAEAPPAAAAPAPAGFPLTCGILGDLVSGVPSVDAREVGMWVR